MILPLPKIDSTVSNGERVDGSVWNTSRDYHDELVLRTVGSYDNHPNTILFGNDISLSTVPIIENNNIHQSGSQNNLRFIYNEII